MMLVGPRRRWFGLAIGLIVVLTITGCPFSSPPTRTSQIRYFNATPNPVLPGGLTRLSWHATDPGTAPNSASCSLSSHTQGNPNPEPAAAVPCQGTQDFTITANVSFQFNVLKHPYDPNNTQPYLIQYLLVTTLAPELEPDPEPDPDPEPGPEPVTVGWLRPGFDLEGSRHYPRGAAVPTTAPALERWRYPFAIVTSEHVLAGDVTGDGSIHLVTAQDGTLHVLRSDGSVRRQVNVSTGSGSTPHAYMLEDTNGDGSLDIGIGYRRHAAYGDNEARVYDESGTVLHEVRRSGSFDGLGMAPVTFVDGDIIVAESAGFAGQPRGFSRWNLATGALVWAYSVGPNYHGHSVADVDGDGKLELSFSTGTPHNGVTANGTNDSNTYTVIVDEDGTHRLTQLYPYHVNTTDSLLDAFVRFRPTEVHQLVSFKTQESPYTGTSRVHVRDLDGTILYTHVGLSDARWSFGWADLDRDGVAEVVATNWSPSASLLTVFDRYLVPNASRALAAGPHLPVVRVITDLDGDGDLDILVSRGTTLTAYDRQLAPMWEWISDVGGIWNVIVSDLDGNGRLDIVVLSESALVVLE
jgi:hypothetical protein